MPSRRSRHVRSAAFVVAGAVAFYLALAYVALPFFWERHYRSQTADDADKLITRNGAGIPGDPLNLAFVASRRELFDAFSRAGWHAADALTWRSSVEIGLSVVFDRSDVDAPVSSLFYEGRKQDIAFEKPVGPSADRRHHIRLWQQSQVLGGRGLWLAAASFDRAVGVSHDTGGITHHIDPDLDSERAFVVQELRDAGAVQAERTEPGSGPTQDGRNGEGDRYFTDGDLVLVMLIPSGLPQVTSLRAPTFTEQ